MRRRPGIRMPASLRAPARLRARSDRAAERVARTLSTIHCTAQEGYYASRQEARPDVILAIRRGLS